jgi:hypothetical protein
MSMQVHQMAIASERRLLPVQAERGWQVEQAAAASKGQSSVIGRQARLRLRTTLVRFGQSLQWVAATTRSANAALT